ncbi:MAG: damage-inducible protein CinA [Planctomycetaceae bacterium]|nr:MAG: damage-inducible protein CinA [Planctomycetaceae bacterium]
MTARLRAEVIAIGDELTSGQRLDTNSQWISTQLALLGVPVIFHTTVTDTLGEGVEAFRIATQRADLVVATGGLGPTADDLTRDVLAALCGVPLELSVPVLKVIETRFLTRQAPMVESNRRQALFPHGSRIIPNPNGTAPGIELDVSRMDGQKSSRVFALPGVPSEMRSMWHDSVVACIHQMQPEESTIVYRRIKCFGAGESAIEDMLPDMIRRDRDPLVGITAHEATVTLRIAARGRSVADCLNKIEPTEEVIRSCLGRLVFGTEDDEVEDAALLALSTGRHTLALIEIGTDGRAAALLSQAQGRQLRDDLNATQSGQHAVAPGGFCGGIVLPLATQSPKMRPPFLADWQTALDMDSDTTSIENLAQRAQVLFGTSIGLAIGAIRPAVDGKSTVSIGIAYAGKTESFVHYLGGDMSFALSRAAKTAINVVRELVAPFHSTL